MWMGLSRGDVVEYSPPQKAKFRGVKITARTVPMAVRLTDRATLALATLEIKFDILPPGQEATSNMPKATEGVMKLPSNHTAMKVTAGKARNWLLSPMIAVRGFRKMLLKFSHFIPRATPNMIKPMEIFIRCRLA